MRVAPFLIFSSDGLALDSLTRRSRSRSFLHVGLHYRDRRRAIELPWVRAAAGACAGIALKRTACVTAPVGRSLMGYRTPYWFAVHARGKLLDTFLHL
ncbi:hypothetical protein EVAR_103952_1 [Eumeta japonica]|uniref:Uncharacterized protein n=1 Tax=Eumeta variegata TaxID=151549 RepID=A0A4C1YF60_EUMVA|nr:hypothetical protein EVAR_103952_1 [Eumeta japonica]